jgi:transcriptional regulator of aromatic amino acid metabolism
MRIDIVSADWAGIAHEVVAVIADRRLNAVAMEVDPLRIHIDAPEVDARSPARGIAQGGGGRRDIVPVDMLPGTRRRLHLDAVLAAMPDPVFAVDAGGAIILANAAAALVAARARPTYATRLSAQCGASQNAAAEPA